MESVGCHKSITSTCKLCNGQNQNFNVPKEEYDKLQFASMEEYDDMQFVSMDTNYNKNYNVATHLISTAIIYVCTLTVIAESLQLSLASYSALGVTGLCINLTISLHYWEYQFSGLIIWNKVSYIINV